MPDPTLQSPTGDDDPKEDADLVSQLETLLSEDEEPAGPAEDRVTAVCTDAPDAEVPGESVGVDQAPGHQESSEAVGPSNVSTSEAPAADRKELPAGADPSTDVDAEPVAPPGTDAPVAAAPPRQASSDQPESETGVPAQEHVAEAEPTLDQVDSMLAAAADRAVGDDFETVSDPQGETPAPRDDVPATTESVDPRPAPAAKPEPTRAIEGQYLTPEQVLSRNVGEEPPTEPAAAKPPVQEPPVASDTERQPVVVAAPSLLQRFLGVLRPRAEGMRARFQRICAWTNQPVNRLASPKRTVVGYVALVTVFNASMLLVGKLIGVVLGY
jgi:hypothetical protein